MPPVAVAAAFGFSWGSARLGLPDAGTSTGGPAKTGLGDQPELAGAGDGLGAVGRAELAEQVGDVFLDGVEGDDEVVGDLLVGCTGGEQVQHLRFAGGQRVDQARDGGSATAAGLVWAAGGRGCPQDGREVAKGYLPGGGLPVPVRGGYLAEQGRHEGAFVGEHPDVALRGGQDKRPCQFFAGGLVTGGRECQ